MRDGTRLATDLYLPPALPAPVIVCRTPYSRGMDAYAGAFLSFARRGYVVVSQDCRGTGDSEPESWDYYVYEPDDGCDLIDWIVRQSWFGGFIGACGGSYVGQTQWPLALHPRMSTIVPEISGLGVAINTARPHMGAVAYARSIGKGAGKVAVPFFELERQVLGEALAGGYFNEPLHAPRLASIVARFPQLQGLQPTEVQRWLWERYCSLGCSARALFVKDLTGEAEITNIVVDSLAGLFGQHISHDRHTLPHVRMDELCRSLNAPALLRTGWYDWGVNDALATWELLMRFGSGSVRTGSRLLIAPSAHNMPGYHEGMGDHPELHHSHDVHRNVELLLQWYETVRSGTLHEWPRVIYYLMGANEWRAAEQWPPAETRARCLYLAENGELTEVAPAGSSEPDSYTYDPATPTPTAGGSIVSYVYPPGSVDVSGVQKRPDVLTYTTPVLKKNLDVAGPLRLVLFASSSACDTDFVARLSDVFPDGRAIQLQNGVLRARFRDPQQPAWLEPGRVYRLEIDMWATANRFAVGHRLRLDISSADFPRFDRNSNRGGEPGPALPALQSIYHDVSHPSHLILMELSRSVDAFQNHSP